MICFVRGQMFADIRTLRDMHERTTMLIEPYGDWVNGSPQFPTGDTSGHFADANITCTSYSSCSNQWGSS